MQDVIEKLPSLFGPDDGQDIPKHLIGAQILGFGTLDFEPRMEGGLVIDYRAKGVSQAKRLILAFNERGMWVDSETPISSETSLDDGDRA